MKLATAGVIALVIAAGLVVTAPFAHAQANPQANPPNYDFSAHIRDLQAKFEDFRSKSQEVVKQSTFYLHFTVMDPKTQERKLVPEPSPTPEGTIRQRTESAFKKAIEERDQSAEKLGAALNAMVALPAKRGDLIAEMEKIYDQMREINLITDDALMRHDEALALLDEQGEADKRAAAAAKNQ